MLELRGKKSPGNNNEMKIYFYTLNLFEFSKRRSSDSHNTNELTINHWVKWDGEHVVPSIVNFVSFFLLGFAIYTVVPKISSYLATIRLFTAHSSQTNERMNEWTNERTNAQTRRICDGKYGKSQVCWVLGSLFSDLLPLKNCFARDFPSTTQEGFSFYFFAFRLKGGERFRNETIE